jgi:dihydroorotate dehydrogenase electron transfer subunit
MHTGKGQVLELILEDGYRHVRVSCPSNLIPSPGQYLLAGDGSDSPLPVPLFHTDFSPQGFIASAPIPESWHPGLELQLRGPLGRGFSLPFSARKIGLIAFEGSGTRLRGLIQPALKQEAGVVFVSDSAAERLPNEVEIQPMSALQDIVTWADFLAFEVKRDDLPSFRERLGKLWQIAGSKESQILVQTPVPCGGMADCGICAVTLRSGWQLACKDGPVFDWHELG